MANKRDRRFPIRLPIVTEIKLALWAHTRGVSKTRMAEAILTDRINDQGNWSEALSSLLQEAEIRQIPPEELIREILKGDGFDSDLDVDRIDWRVLLVGIEPELEEDQGSAVE